MKMSIFAFYAAISPELYFPENIVIFSRIIPQSPDPKSPDSRKKFVFLPRVVTPPHPPFVPIYSERDAISLC